MLPIVPETQRLSTLVRTVLGLNPGPFTLQGTNTFIVGSGQKRILIDTGSGLEEYKQLLHRITKEEQIEISDIVVTHAHMDHIGGIEDVKSLFPDCVLHKMHPPPGYQPLRDAQVLKTEGATLRVVETPGHTSDHISLFLEEEESLFTGDCILGNGSTIFEDLSVYLQSLRKLLDLKPKRLYCGHGVTVEDGMCKIQEYIQHRLDRELQILSLLDTPKTAQQLVKEIYSGYPQGVQNAAMHSLQLHLRKLLQDKRILCQDSTFSKI
ncbi:lactamase, beta 2 [Gorgonomyces haynaldii]|nr:lactamase, beta 2 [Gorgonomyces haynaldii]